MEKTKKQNKTPKNKITLFEGIGEEKRKYELYNFQIVDHIVIDGRSYVRVLCDNRYYYFRAQLTAIAKIESF